MTVKIRNEEWVDMVADLRYMLTYGSLAKNGEAIPFEERELRSIVLDDMRRCTHEEFADWIITHDQSVEYGGVKFSGKVHSLTRRGTSYIGRMSPLDGAVSLTIVRDDTSEWQVSSARMRYAG